MRHTSMNNHDTAKGCDTDIDTDIATNVESTKPNIWLTVTPCHGSFEIKVTPSGGIRVYSLKKAEACLPVASPKLGFNLGNCYVTAEDLVSRHLYDTPWSEDAIPITFLSGRVHDFRFSNIVRKDAVDKDDNADKDAT